MKISKENKDIRKKNNESNEKDNLNYFKLSR